MTQSQEMAPARLKEWVTAEVERNPLLKVIYYQSVDARTMQEVAAWDDSPASRAASQYRQEIFV